MMLVIMNRSTELKRGDKYEVRRHLDCMYILRKNESPIATKKADYFKTKFIEKNLTIFFDKSSPASHNRLGLICSNANCNFFKIREASIFLYFNFAEIYMPFIKSLTKHPPLFTYKSNKKRVESLL